MTSQVAQINLMRHQHLDLPANEHKKRKSIVKPRPPSHKNYTSDRQSNYKKSFDSKNVYKTRRDVRSVEIQIILKVSSVQQRNFNASLVICMDTLQVHVTKRNKLHSSQGNQRPECYKQVLHMLVTSPYAATLTIVHPAMSHSLCK